MKTKHFLLLIFICFNLSIKFSRAHENRLIKQEASNFSSINIREICDGLFFEPRPLPGISRYFIGCIKGEGVVFQCDMDKIFNPTTLICENEEIGSTTTQILTTTTQMPTKTGPTFTTTEIPVTTTEMPTKTTQMPTKTGPTFTTTEIPVTTTQMPTKTGPTFTTTEIPVTTTQIMSTTTQMPTKTGPTLTTTEIPVTTTQIMSTTTPNYEILCKGLNFDFINDPNDCGIGIFCFKEVPIVTECPANTIFDINLSECRNGNRDTCEFYDSTTEIQTTTIDLTGICDGLDRVFLEFPNDCRKAIYCLNGDAVISTCRENTIFDVEIGECRYGDPNTCEFYDITTTKSTAPEPNYDVLCEGRFDEFVNHPTRCAKAIYCHNQKAITRECSPGTIFDIQNGECRPGDAVTCEFYKMNIKAPTQTDDDVLKALCKGQHLNYIKYPQKCDRAIFCFHEHPILKQCPFNNLFDFGSESCRQGNPATCELSSTN